MEIVNLRKTFALILFCYILILILWCRCISL